MFSYSRCPLALLPWVLAYPILCSISSHAQQISTSTPLPALQWINITNLLGGTAPAPPLKDAAIGYDDTSRNVLIFGGESSQGIPQSQTYLCVILLSSTSQNLPHLLSLTFPIHKVSTLTTLSGSNSHLPMDLQQAPPPEAPP